MLVSAPRYKSTAKTHDSFYPMKETMNIMRKSLKTLASSLALALTLVVGSTAALAFPGGAPSATAQPSAAPTPIKGTVAEVIESGGYTYLSIENDGKKIWVAIPKTEIKVGQKVELAPGTEFKKYTSKSLGRTFDSVYFSTGLSSAQGNQPAAMPPGHPEIPGQGMPPGHPVLPAQAQGMPPGHPAMSAGEAPQAAVISGTVVETFDSGGYSYVAVEQAGKRTWVACPKVKVTVGQKAAFLPGQVMQNFTSKTLGRTFDTIVFSNGLAPAPATPAKPAAGK